MIAQETAALVAESLENILQFSYENTRTRLRSIIYNIV